MIAARRQKGVTLVELLIALLIFAMISSVGVFALRLVVDGREQLVTTDQRLREWQVSRLIMRQDLAQISLRIVRDEFGAALSNEVVGGLGFSGRRPIAGETPLIGFVRDGWANFDPNIPRSTLQYVEYILKDDDIIRRTRPYLDDARNQPKRDRILFEDVTNVEINFLVGETSRGLDWSKDWPAPGGSGVPRAVRLIMTSPRYGEVEQLFWIGQLGGASLQ